MLIKRNSKSVYRSGQLPLISLFFPRPLAGVNATDVRGRGGGGLLGTNTITTSLGRRNSQISTRSPRRIFARVGPSILTKKGERRLAHPAREGLERGHCLVGAHLHELVERLPHFGRGQPRVIP